MLNTYSELRLGGGVLVAPFVGYATLALAVSFAMRLVLMRTSLGLLLSESPMVEACIYIWVLAGLIILF